MLGFLMLPEWRAYICRFFCPSVYPFICPSICPTQFFNNLWTKSDKTSCMNSLGYCTDVLFLFYGRKGFLVEFQFLLISHSVFVKISLNFIVILLIESFTMCTCFFMPPQQKIGGILFYCCPSVCLTAQT